MIEKNQKDMPFSVKQLKAIEILARGGNKQLKDIAVEIGISERQLLNWRTDPNFMSAVVSRSRDIIREELPDVYCVLTHQAKGGNPAHIKILLDHLENLEEMKAKANEGQITFTWHTPTNEDNSD